MIIYLLIGIIGGFLSGFMGIGGGIIMVPFMVFLRLFTTFSSRYLTSCISIPIVIFGAYQYYLQGNVNVKAALVIALFFSIGIYFGSKYAQSINPETLKIILAS
ncbi:hypothetical protein CM15mP43_07580 [bacterium]|nr:MAG: hypothetical protein CM15mP43_07580 [bacterium]